MGRIRAATSKPLMANRGSFTSPRAELMDGLCILNPYVGKTTGQSLAKRRRGAVTGQPVSTWANAYVDFDWVQYSKVAVAEK
jgi:hypothetical protein